jgi:hypothetical protein
LSASKKSGKTALAAMVVLYVIGFLGGNGVFPVALALACLADASCYLPQGTKRCVGIVTQAVGDSGNRASAAAPEAAA